MAISRRWKTVGNLQQSDKGSHKRELHCLEGAVFSKVTMEPLSFLSLSLSLSLSPGVANWHDSTIGMRSPNGRYTSDNTEHVVIVPIVLWPVNPKRPISRQSQRVVRKEFKNK